MSEEFKFIIETPKLDPSKDESYQLFKIYAKYPMYVYSCPVNKYSSMTRDEHLRLAISELKVKLIADISSAEFEESHE